MTSVSCGPRTIVGGAKTLSIAGGASLLPAILCAEHSYLPASDACTSDIIRLPESTIDNLFERNETRKKNVMRLFIVHLTSTFTSTSTMLTVALKHTYRHHHRRLLLTQRNLLQAHLPEACVFEACVCIVHRESTVSKVRLAGPYLPFSTQIQ